MMRKIAIGLLAGAALLWTGYWGARYFDGKRLGSGDLTQEQNYRLKAAGFGIVGLAVLAAMLLAAGWIRSKSDED